MTLTYETVGYFHAPTGLFADWLLGELMVGKSGWVRRELTSPNSEVLVESLLPLADVGVSRYLLLSSESWTAVVNNGRLGTDLGMIPSLAARKLKCRAIRVTAIEDRPDRYGATILEVYDPEAGLPLRCRRTISVANDGAKWSFDQSGEPFEFEDKDAYSHRRIRDRFTKPLLHRYVRALGVPAVDLGSMEGKVGYILDLEGVD